MGGQKTDEWPSNPDWRSPETTSEDPTLMLWVEADWVANGALGAILPGLGSQLTVPHPSNGKVMKMETFPPGVNSPATYGFQGGNIGYLDGSVSWKPAGKMTTHTISQYDSTTFVGTF